MKNKVALPIILSFLLLGCIDTIPVELNKGFRDNIVIQAKLVKGDPHRVEVRLSQLFDFTVASRSTLRGRSALIRNQHGQSLPLKFQADGFYVLDIEKDDPNFIVNDFEEFQVEAVDNLNRVYQSSFEPLMPNPGIDSLEIDTVSNLVQYFNGVLNTFEAIQYRVNVPTALPGKLEERARLLWLIETNYQLTDRPTLFNDWDIPNCQGGEQIPKTCWIDRIASLYDPVMEDFNATNVDDYERINLVDDPILFYYAEGLYFNLFQESLSETAYAYWSEVDISIVRSGTLFDPVVGEIRTNFTSLSDPDVSVHGFFYATEVDTIRKYIPPVFAGNIDSLCYWEGFNPLDPECPCVNCLTQEKSDTVKPSYWEY